MFNMVRDGKRVAPTCPECGCRLKVIYGERKIWGENAYFYSHFEGLDSRDARGCLCTEISTYYINMNGKVSEHYMY